MEEIITCPACGCEAERVAKLMRGDKEIGYVDSCGARVVNGCVVGNN
jgi:hypothetical protein